MLKEIFLGTVISSLALTSVYAADQAVDKNLKKDGEVLSILVALNNNEINAAKDVVDKTDNQQVKDYANMMIKEHGDNLDETNKLIEKLNVQDVKSAKATSLQKQGDSEVKKLSGLKEPKLDKAYINDMVKDHAGALKMIDKELLKQVNNDDVKNHLTATREHVAHHLEEAKAIQKSMKG